MLPDVKTVREETKRIQKDIDIEHKKNLPIRLERELNRISEEILNATKIGQNGFLYRGPYDLRDLVKKNLKDAGYSVSGSSRTVLGFWVSWK